MKSNVAYSSSTLEFTLTEGFTKETAKELLKLYVVDIGSVNIHTSLAPSKKCPDVKLNG